MTGNPGRGAWVSKNESGTVYYKLSSPGLPQVGSLAFANPTLDVACDYERAVNFGVKQIMRRIRAMGYTGTLSSVGVINHAGDTAIRWAQAQLWPGEPHEVDGLCGPNTCRRMFQPLVMELEETYGVPNNWGCKVTQTESGWDPGAVGELTPEDEGLGQCNLPATKFTHTQAFSYTNSLEYLVARLRNTSLLYVNNKYGIDPYELAVVSYNSPVRARNWAKTGTLSSAGKKYLEKVRTATIAI